MGIVKLQKYFFTDKRTVIYENNEFTVSLFRYPSEIEAVEIVNSRGKVVLLPFYGQMIWDLHFDDCNLKMKNMFKQPKKATCIEDTYGCFAFHSGLLSNGCPSPEDNHILHGEMACAEMDEAWLEITSDFIKLGGMYEYTKGFGHHYEARPTVTLSTGESFIHIEMKVKNLSSTKMPLQYMCHLNYAYVPQGVMKQNIPDDAFRIRESIPAHIRPNETWLTYTKELANNGGTISQLNSPEMYDPEIVFFAEHIEQYQETAQFEITSTEGNTFFSEFSTTEFPFATRWLLYNGDQQVAAFVLPGTSLPEGFLAAKESGSLIYLSAGEERTFRVTTGKK
ncbi:DUF4432 family protein [Bacillus ginsengihumi]|uniref:DUF4432 family protein n=1 Tax=Heyndrickxia ginsengihumi TaxID=363870 RepID=A0A6M0P7L6_9BACI|nr:aldose 1-epimerase family protein [Heyndrickxia ginsengihumi]MCM3023191.1 aldose 1-epimerase family protein [Heyndrickxia ginsengihumi]NEY20019.1 DUF4432 family protein [Heyndrickxia ginsengihumi]